MPAPEKNPHPHNNANEPGPSNPATRSNRIYSARPWTAAGRSPIMTENSNEELGPPSLRLPGDARGSTTSLPDAPDEIIIDPTKIGQDSATRHLLIESKPSTSALTNEPLTSEHHPSINAKPRLRKIFGRQHQVSSETVRTIESPRSGHADNGLGAITSILGDRKEPEIVRSTPEVRFYEAYRRLRW